MLDCQLARVGPSAQAQDWSPAARELTRTYEHPLRGNPYAETLFGLCNGTLTFRWQVSGLKSIRLVAQDLGGQPLTIQTDFQKNKNAELIVILPPLFSTGDDLLSLTG